MTIGVGLALVPPGQVAPALSMLAGMFGRDVGLQLEIDQAVEDDLRALGEADFHQRIVSRSRWHDRMNATGLADPLTVEAGEIARLLVCLPHRDGHADHWATSRRRARFVGRRLS